MTWWKKRTSERDVLRRTLVGITVKTELELAVAEMRRAFDNLEATVAKIPEEPAGE
jgi:hypothetical protein